MELATKNPKSGTPVKDPHGSQSKVCSKYAENSNPNVSPASKSAKSHKSAPRNPNPVKVAYSPRKKIRERKFVVAKKKGTSGSTASAAAAVDCKCRERFGGNVKKCLCVAYETLRASQEEFLKNGSGEEQNGEDDGGLEKGCDVRAESEAEEEAEKENHEFEDGFGNGYGSDDRTVDGSEQTSQTGSSTIKRRRAKLLEEARNSVPEFGKVKHLVKAFERMFSIPNPKESDEKEEKELEDAKKKAMKWALPGLQQQQPPKAPETLVSSSSDSFGPSELLLTAENLGLDSRGSVSSSWDSSQGSISSRTSNGGRRSRRNSIESSGTIGGRRWKKKQLKATSQKPFKLRTEQRGRLKEEEFMKKIQEMMLGEEKQRIPIAQGLPWTTDEPECLIKPIVKENTRPVDLKLHSDIRAVERADFDHQVAEKLCLIEQYKMERERQQKLFEEEEVRRLRKELIPKAQPMPYFDRPFMPRRSMKHPTIPKEPKFHVPQHKKIKSCLSWTDMDTYTYQQ